jgi:hypothetical protein
MDFLVFIGGYLCVSWYVLSFRMSIFISFEHCGIGRFCKLLSRVVVTVILGVKFIYNEHF